jgi:hypothetical protein
MEVCPSPDGWRVAVARVTALERPPSNPGATIAPPTAWRRGMSDEWMVLRLSGELWVTEGSPTDVVSTRPRHPIRFTTPHRQHHGSPRSPARPDRAALPCAGSQPVAGARRAALASCTMTTRPVFRAEHAKAAGSKAAVCVTRWASTRGNRGPWPAFAPAVAMRAVRRLAGRVRRMACRA